MRLRDMPIQRKLLLSVVAAVVFAYSCASVAVIAYEQTTRLPRAVAEAQAKARVLADLIVPAVLFEDDISATNQLISMRRDPAVLAGVVFLPDGSVFAREGTGLPETLPSSTDAILDKDRIIVVEPVVAAAREVGHLVIAIRRIDLLQALQPYAFPAVAVGCSFALLALLLSYVLQRSVVAPVTALVATSRAVTERRDYSLRAARVGDDEFGRLATAFNGMLAAVAERDAAQRAQEERLARQNQALVELAHAEIASQGNLDRELDLVLGIICRACKVRHAGLWLLEDGGATLRCVCNHDAEGQHRRRESLRRENAPAYFAALQEGRPIEVADIHTDPRCDGFRDDLAATGIRAMLDIPVRRHGVVVGVLCHEHPSTPRVWTRDEATFGSAAVDRIVVILEADDLRRAEAALRDSEARYRGIVETAPDAIFTIDAHGLVRETNPSFARLIGRDVGAAQGFLALIALDDRPLAESCLAAARDQRKSSVAELAFLVADGGTIPVECIFSPRGGKHEAGRGDVLCIGRDLSERHSAMQAQLRLEDQLRHAQKMEAIGTLAGGIAHDFNNILTVISGNLQLADGDLGPGHAGRASFEQAFQATKRAKELVGQILTFSRRKEPRRELVQVESVAEEVARMVRPLIGASYTVRVECPGNPPPVLADINQLHQVVLNLTTNAAHAMEPAGGLIRITVDVIDVTEELVSRHPQLAPGRQVRLAVIDTGTGMDEATLRRLFEPFFTTKQHGRGTGLGLAVVHGIVQSHQGAVVVSSRVGVGTRFEVYLPVADAPAPPSDRDVAPAPPPPPAPPAEARILLIDDDLMVMRVTRSLLRRRGYAVQAFSDPLAGLDALQATPDAFDLVITDLTMPAMNGLQVAARAAELRPGIAILLTTGYSGDIDDATLAALHIAGPLHKPFDADALLDGVASALAARAPRGVRG